MSLDVWIEKHKDGIWDSSWLNLIEEQMKSHKEVNNLSGLIVICMKRKDNRNYSAAHIINVDINTRMLSNEPF